MFAATHLVGFGAGGAGASDPNFADVILLCHANGADLSTTFTDSSSIARTLTANGNVHVTTTVSKFGGASLNNDGAGDFVSAADSTDWAFAGDFTIEAWIRIGTLDSDRAIVSQAVDDNNMWGFYLDIASGNGLRFVQIESSSVTINISQGATTGWSTVTWYHVALVRSGTTFYLFRDGTQIATGTDATAIGNFAAVLNIGGPGGATTTMDYWSDSLDDIRITNVARYTAGFTAPTEEFPDQ